MNKDLEDILRGRKFKKLVDVRFSQLRKSYDLKQIEVDILYYIHMAKTKVTASELCKNMELNKGQVSIAMDRLETLGYIRKLPESKDKRLIHYELEKKALPLIKDIDAITNEVKESLLEGVNQEEIKLLCSIFQKLTHNMDAMINEEK